MLTEKCADIKQSSGRSKGMKWGLLDQPEAVILIGQVSMHRTHTYVMSESLKNFTVGGLHFVPQGQL